MDETCSVLSHVDSVKVALFEHFLSFAFAHLQMLLLFVECLFNLVRPVLIGLVHFMKITHVEVLSVDVVFEVVSLD